MALKEPEPKKYTREKEKKKKIRNLKTQNERHYLSSIGHQSLHGILMHTSIHIFAHTLIRKCIREKGHFSFAWFDEIYKFESLGAPITSSGTD